MRPLPIRSAARAAGRAAWPAVLVVLASLLPAPAADAGRRRGNGVVPLEAGGFQLWAGPQSNPIALSADGSELYVANTTSNTLDVIDTTSNPPAVVATVRVGLEPVSVAVRPGSSEVWVSNHVSDSVSVVDVSLAPPEVVETVQEIGADRVSDFDEPVGIAFRADGARAYVALSSRNRVAVVDAAAYAVVGALAISAQEPRALDVAGGLLYVAAFESGNQSEISACSESDSLDAPACTLRLTQSKFQDFGLSPNLPGEDKNVVIDADVPDRDLFVFDTTQNDQPVAQVTGAGTLLYGVAADAGGNVYVSQTSARNAVNGITCNQTACPQGDGDANADGDVNLADLQNRMFDNQIAFVGCSAAGCGGVGRVDLEPALPSGADEAAADGSELATPYGIRVSGDGTTLVVTAAASSRVFTFDTAAQAVLDRLDVGAIPRGVALRSDAAGAPQTAYVLNTFGNSVTVVDVSDPSNLSAGPTIAVGDDPTPDPVRLGRIAFNDATASSSGTFACASCHPDGHTDQLVWRIGGECLLDGCVAGEDEPRTTMPVRGLRNTLPLHWDGTLGDPFGGANGAVGPGANGGSSCGPDDQGCFRQLADASLAGVMCAQQGGCAAGPSGLPGLLSSAERDDMAAFLQRVAHPPARSRPVDDLLTASARDGFADFFVDQGGIGTLGGAATCGAFTGHCHTLPVGASTCDDSDGFPSCVVGAFDAPSMRGMTDRFVLFSMGVGGPEEVVRNETVWTPAVGMDEFSSFQSLFRIGFTPAYVVADGSDLFQMFEEASTGHSGAIGRQVTLNTLTAAGCPACEAETILAELEAADAAGVVNLRGRGRRGANGGFQVGYTSAGSYRSDRGATFTRSQLVNEAQQGGTLLTFTAELRSGVGDLVALPQPLLSPAVLFDDSIASAPIGATSLDAVGVDVRDGARVFVDGVPTGGQVACNGGAFTPFCSTQSVNVGFGGGLAAGLHLVQVQNPKGLLSNELPVCAGGGDLCD